MRQTLGTMFAIMVVVMMTTAACGGKLSERIPNPTPGDTEPGPTRPVDDDPISVDLPKPNPYPTPTPITPTPTPTTPPTPITPTPVPVDPTPPDPSDPIGATLPPTKGVACTLGAQVAMSYRIPSHNFSGHGGVAYCTGVVEFGETFDASHWDTSKTPWVMVKQDANGRSIKTDTKQIPNHVHTSTVVYGDGVREEQYCTFFALCENGVARSVSFTW